MNPEIQRFAFAEATIARKKRTTAGLLGGILVAVTLPAILSPNQTIGAVVAGLTVVVVFTVILLQMRWMFRRFREMRLHLGTSGVVKESGAVRQELAWEKITRLKFRKGRKGDLRSVEIHQASGRPLSVSGFANMDEIARILQSKAPSNAEVVIKQVRVDPENPYFLFGLIVLGAMFYQSVRGSPSEGWIVRGNTVVQCLLGGWIGLYGPISRQNPKFRRWEVALATLIVVFGLLSLAIDLWDHHVR